MNVVRDTSQSITQTFKQVMPKSEPWVAGLMRVDDRRVQTLDSNEMFVLFMDFIYLC